MGGSFGGLVTDGSILLALVEQRKGQCPCFVFLLQA